MPFDIKILFLLSLLLLHTKQESESLEFKGETINKSNQDTSDVKTYKIKTSSQTNYLKITAKGKDSGNKANINHIISYHLKENDINEREQLSFNETGTTIMYLNRAQLKPEFYITIQCEEIPCSYDFLLEPKDNAELNLDDSFSYYVTESNKQMIFNISASLSSSKNLESEGNVVTIYAVGNHEINSTLESKNNCTITKHKTRSAYLIQIPKLNEVYEFTLTIDGKSGDLINIGSHFHDSKYSVSTKKVPENDGFIFGYLKKGIKTKNCFPTNFNGNLFKLVYDLDNPISKLFDFYATYINSRSSLY